MANAIPAAYAAEVKGKIIAVYHDGGTAKLVIEFQEPLIAGKAAYAGPNKVEISLGELMSRSEQRYYYNASSDGKADIHQGDEVVLEGPTSGASIIATQIKEHYAFEQKRIATVTAVQGDHAMINRGSLHEVRERDIYRLYDSSGGYKGMIELRGIGDLQSSGKLYNALEDTHRRALSASVGDKAVFVGQRKLFALGMVGGFRSSPDGALGQEEKTWTAGLLWSLTFPDGWGVEVLFGTAFRYLNTQSKDLTSSTQVQRQAAFIAPVWFKKNFFFPSPVSPFVAGGLSLLNAQDSYIHNGSPSNITDSRNATTVVPVLGTGVELFSGRFFRPRFEISYFDGPTLAAGNDSFSTRSVYYGLGFLSTW